MNRVLGSLNQALSCVALLTLLSGCGEAEIKKTTKHVEKLDTYEKLIGESHGAAYRIQLDLELKDTGEAINFDYMVRCANIDVPGSLHPIISGQTHFKALSTGAAVAVSAPHHYCKRSLSNAPFNKPGDVIKMPVLAWYDNVNDLSHTWAYLTNDAYLSPLAKVSFIDFKVTRATGNEYREWAEETSRNYEKIGAIPGPFGCMTSNAISSEPESCAYPERLERNGGKYLQVIDDGVLERHLYSVPFVKDGFDMKAIKSELSSSNGYFCSQTTITVPKDEVELKKQEGSQCYTVSGKCPTRKTTKGKDHPYIRDYSEQTKKFSKAQYSNFSRLKNRKLVNYLDPVCLRDKSVCDIRTVYPVITIKTKNGYVHRMLRKPEYKGFSIQSGTGFTSNDFDGFNPTGFRTLGGQSDTGVLFVNNELVCDRFGQVFSFYDFNNSEFIRSTTQY